MPRSYKYALSLFIFRRDLRLEDNTALIAALKTSKFVLPLFIFDPRQCEDNSYKSCHSINFMLESLEDLQRQLHKKSGTLYFDYGIAEKIVDKWLKKLPIEALFFNQDYTPFSCQRDHKIEQICKKQYVDFHSYHDALLLKPADATKLDGKPYQVFSAFYRQAINISIPLPEANSYSNYYQDDQLETQVPKKLTPYMTNKYSFIKGGRTRCLEILENLDHLNHYKQERDFPSKQATSGLSPYLKFTNCSVREIYYAIKRTLADSDAILRELYWRDFFTLIAFHYPQVFGQPFNKKYLNVSWHDDELAFKRWCQGETGFPIVDAGMKELNETGYMHNRVRLITASFLVKDLHINWLWGEKYFAQRLIDYDPAVNNGNWQWVAGTGTDAQPYFRIFNPWLQQKKFDPDCQYIKNWLPALKAVPAKIIHRWYESKYHTLAKYPAPIVDHQNEVLVSKKLYQS